MANHISHIVSTMVGPDTFLVGYWVNASWIILISGIGLNIRPNPSINQPYKYFLICAQSELYERLKMYGVHLSFFSEMFREHFFNSYNKKILHFEHIILWLYEVNLFSEDSMRIFFLLQSIILCSKSVFIFEQKEILLYILRQ